MTISGWLGREQERALVKYIQHLEKAGFPPRSSIWQLAYSFTEKISICHWFNRDTKLAGYDWLQLFLKRHPELMVRKAQGLSIIRGLGICWQEVDDYFTLILHICQENDVLANPSKIHNKDECGLQMNNEPGKVVATKGGRDVHHVTSGEKDETISLIARCNAKGKFLPPYCIFKGKRKKNEFEDGMPPGSHVTLNEISAYMNTVMFLKCPKNHIIPRKERGKVLLILDGHRSHCSDVNVFDFAADNDVIIPCLPSHTMQYLQPLDRSFFKSLKTFWQE
jgi:hypothetical protein